MLIIPLSAIPSQKLKVVLENQDCELALLTRGDHLYLDLTVNGAVVQQGALIVNKVSIIQKPTDVFSGTLAMLDTLGTSDPVWSGLGDRWVLFYFSEGEDGEPRNLVPEFDGVQE